MKHIITTIFPTFFACVCIGQTSYPTRDSVHVFWQPNVKLTYNDYKGQLNSKVLEKMEKYQIFASASVGIWSVLDIPKKKKDSYKKFEKVYFAPAFDRTASSAKSNDTLQIEMQNIYFDICEVWARWARKELKRLQDSTKATGTLSIFYMTVKQDMNDNQKAMYKAYFKDVFANKNDGAFAKWRADIDKQLEETKQWATTPEECYRLMTQKPIEEGYIKAATLIGPMLNDKK